MGGGGAWGGEGVTPSIKVYGDVPQVWVMFSHLLVFIKVINSRFLAIILGYHLPVVCICYGHGMRMNGIFGQKMEQILLGFQAVSR